MSLSDTRPFRLLDGIARHLNSAQADQPPDFATLTDLVRHPDVSRWIDARISEFGSDAPTDWLTELDKYLADHLQAIPGTLLGRSPRRDLVGHVLNAVRDLLSHLVPQPASVPSADELSADVAAAGVIRSAAVQNANGGSVRGSEASVQTSVRPASASNALSTRQRQPNGAGSGRRRGSGKSVDSSQRLLFDDSHAGGEVCSVMNRLRSRRSLRFWGDGLLRLLQAVYENYEADSETLRDRGIIACVDALSDAVDQLHQIPDAVIPDCDAAQALQLLTGRIATQSIPPTPDDQAVELLGWLELPMDDSPVLILTGFNEGYVPESVSSDVFLPNSLRSHLQLRDNRRRYARDAYALSVLLHSRERFTCIAGRTDNRGNPLMPSRLWFATDPAGLPERVRMFYDEDAQTRVPHPSIAAATAETSALSEFAAPVPASATDRSGFVIPCPVAPPAPEEISVTAFRDYMYCPYRYLLKRELRLTPIEDETLELSAPAFGNLMHDVLNRFGRSSAAESDDRIRIIRMLKSELQRLAHERLGMHLSATVAVQLEMLENRLEAFSHWQAQTIADGWRILHTEASLTYHDFTDCRGRPVALTGRVDRVDRNFRTGEYRVLDYKTSERAENPEKTHRSSDGEWIDLQLPLYRLLVQSLGIDGDVRLGYVHLPGDLSKIGCTTAEWSDDDITDAVFNAKRVAADILDLRIDRIERGDSYRSAEFARLCQDSVVEQNAPWLPNWPGRSS